MHFSSRCVLCCITCAHLLFLRMIVWMWFLPHDLILLDLLQATSIGVGFRAFREILKANLATQISIA